jgi:hypothetical protein
MYPTARNRDLFRQFAGCKVRITDDSGDEIAIGTMDENGLVHAVIDGEEYTQQLTHLTMGDD